MKKVIGIFLTLLMALSLSGYSGIGTAIRGGRTSEQPEATKTPAPEATAGQEPEDPGILVSPAEEYAFRMELFDKNWSYERPAFEGGAYEITTDSPSAFAIIRTALVTYPDDFVDDEVLDGFNDYLANHYTNAGEGGRLRVLEKRTFPVGDGSGRALIGQIAVGEEYASLAIVSWAKKGEGPHDSFLYFALALTDPPAFEAACSEMKMMLMSFQTTEEYERDGEPTLPEGSVRGCAFDIPYTKAEYLEGEDGNCRIRVVIQIRNTGTVPLWISGASSFDVQDGEGKVLASCPFALPSPESILPGESSLSVEYVKVEEAPAGPLTVIDNIYAEDETNLCLRYPVSEIELWDLPGKGLQMTGTLLNNGNVTVYYVYLIVNLYDSEHRPIGQLKGIMNDTLQPWEETQITAGEFLPFVKAEEVAEYEVFAYPLPYQAWDLYGDQTR